MTMAGYRVMNARLLLLLTLLFFFLFIYCI